ncbi:MarR family transcriptional regulator [Deinococcus sp.]|uniref:MarR family winged helix-turn-helix transcriptional regulator n=1 Tax=Deinococcus sp. TaxID=47478 RepID=UPI0025BE98C7|nr:MarR family transcriptional regulator [Deinococcus sp.]
MSKSHEGPVDPALDDLIELISQFGRTKLSLQSLLLRPKWRNELVRQFNEANIELQDPELYFQWLPIFYRLSRRLMNEEGSMNMRAVAEAIGVPLSTATRLTDNFVTHGLMERQPDAHDRRMVMIRLTTKGQLAYQIADRNARDRLEDLLKQLTPEERAQLLPLGTRLFHFWMASLEEMAFQSNSNKEAPTP